MNRRQRGGLILFLVMANTNLMGLGTEYMVIWIGLMILGACFFISNKGGKK